MNTNTAYVLRQTASGRYYSHMTLGADVMTDSADNARTWTTAAAAAKYGARFGDRYEAVQING